MQVGNTVKLNQETSNNFGLIYDPAKLKKLSRPLPTIKGFKTIAKTEYVLVDTGSKRFKTITIPASAIVEVIE